MARTGSRGHRGARRGEPARARGHVRFEPLAADDLIDVPTFADLRFDREQRTAFESLAAQASDPQDLQPGCVVRLDRGFPLVATEQASVRAEHAVAFALNAKVLPAVGDWVVVRLTPGHDKAVIESVLPRRSTFERWRGHRRGERQILCANVDTILIIQTLGAGDVLLDRIARSLVLANDFALRSAVVLTKADRCDAAERDREIARVRRLAGAAIDIAVTSALDRSGLDEVRALVTPKTCAMTLGESGVGKSTLVNALLGHDALATADVRARDDAGRHTTVARIMVALPGAGVISDAPGLRSLPLVGHERGLALTFSEIVEASRRCRFADCTHTSEPDCALREAASTGEIDPLRLTAFLALAREMRVSAQSLDPDVHP